MIIARPSHVTRSRRASPRAVIVGLRDATRKGERGRPQLSYTDTISDHVAPAYAAGTAPAIANTERPDVLQACRSRQDRMRAGGPTARTGGKGLHWGPWPAGTPGVPAPRRGAEPQLGAADLLAVSDGRP